MDIDHLSDQPEGYYSELSDEEDLSDVRSLDDGECLCSS